MVLAIPFSSRLAHHAVFLLDLVHEAAEVADAVAYVAAHVRYSRLAREVVGDGNAVVHVAIGVIRTPC